MGTALPAGRQCSVRKLGTISLSLYYRPLKKKNGDAERLSTLPMATQWLPLMLRHTTDAKAIV